MIQEGNLLKAENGAVLRRKSTEEMYGEELYLGYTYYLNGERLAEPHLDTIDDFEEVLTPEEALEIITSK